MGLFWELYRECQFTDVQSEAATAKNMSVRLRRDVDQLRRQVDTMALANQAMWEILRDKLGVPEDVLLQKMQEIDLRDRQADGKMTPSPVSCPDCARLNNSARATCIYCGSAIPGERTPE